MTAGEMIKELGQVAPDTEVKVSAGETHSLRIEAVRYMGYRDGFCTILTFDGGEE
jgi:hypothetical protein